MLTFTAEASGETDLQARGGEAVFEASALSGSSDICCSTLGSVFQITTMWSAAFGIPAG